MTRDQVTERLKRDADHAARRVPTMSGLVDNLFWSNPIGRIVEMVCELLK